LRHAYALSLTLLTLSFAAPALHAAAAPVPPASAAWLPESERALQPCFIGLEAPADEYFLLPKLTAPAQALEGWHDAQRQLYWLNLELSHGALLKALPPQAQVYAAVPHGSAKAQAWLRDYLHDRAGWSDADLDARLHCFSVPVALIWPQDATVVLGTDARGRVKLAYAPQAGEHYRGFVDGLVGSFPLRFVRHRLPDGISSEGGDIAVVRRPDGSLGLVLGRHRVLDWLQAGGHGDYLGKPVPPALLAQARRAYARAYGLPVQVVPSAALRQGWGSEDLFHLDMLTSFFSVSGRACVMVPSFRAGARDSFSNQPFDPAQDRDWRREMDQVADELAQAGYQVGRAPLADHPVRSPSNTVRLPLPGGGQSVLLARYPDQRPGSAPSAGALQYQVSLAQLREAGERWNQAPVADQLPALKAALQAAWEGLDRAQLFDNPVFDAQAAAYRALGCQVQGVPSYPWGAGGFHCQFLH